MLQKVTLTNENLKKKSTPPPIPAHQTIIPFVTPTDMNTILCVHTRIQGGSIRCYLVCRIFRNFWGGHFSVTISILPVAQCLLWPWRTIPSPHCLPEDFCPFHTQGGGSASCPGAEAPAGPHVLAFAAWVYADQDFLFEHKR